MLKVELVTVPSNLGKGEVLYFKCPVSGRRCRILYMAYSSPYFKCRAAYYQRLYYFCQIESKRHYANSRYWALDRKIEALEEDINGRYFYANQPTRKARYIEQLKMQKRYWDRERSNKLVQFLTRRYGKEFI